MAFNSGNLSSSVIHKKSVRIIALLMLVIPFTFLLFYWCHVNNSLALHSYAFLAFFNMGSLFTCLVSLWASKQQPTSKFSYGFERINVLSVFSCTLLLILFGLYLVKHSLERVFAPPVVSTDNMLLGVCFGLGIHVLVSCGITNRPLMHAAEAAPPNWLQTALHDLGHSVGSFFPSLNLKVLFKVNPITLLELGGAASLVLTQLLIDLDELYLADVAGALFICALIFCTMLPLSIYTAKILLQTAPEHVLPLLDKSLREVSTLNGVLELKNEHFWTITFGSYAGSIHVRVRRDANEQEVLTQMTSRLASQMNDLTIQVVKDDWSLPHMPTPAKASPRMTPTHHGYVSPPLAHHTPLSSTHAHSHGGGGWSSAGHSHAHSHQQDHGHAHSHQQGHGHAHSHQQGHGHGRLSVSPSPTTLQTV